jgi:hypothetical protein
MKEHDLKTWLEPFAAILNGSKRHEVRVIDCGFAIGDVLLLREWAPSPGMPLMGDYTGRSVRVSVTYLTPGGTWGLPADLCVMSIAPSPAAPDPEAVERRLTLADALRDERWLRREVLAACHEWEPASDDGPAGFGGPLLHFRVTVDEDGRRYAEVRRWLARSNRMSGWESRHIGVDQLNAPCDLIPAEAP